MGGDDGAWWLVIDREIEGKGESIGDADADPEASKRTWTSEDLDTGNGGKSRVGLVESGDQSAKDILVAGRLIVGDKFLIVETDD